jgi:hypothetical protein
MATCRISFRQRTKIIQRHLFYLRQFLERENVLYLSWYFWASLMTVNIHNVIFWAMTKWHWDRFSQNDLVSPTNSHSTDRSTLINHPIIDAIYSRY